MAKAVLLGFLKNKFFHSLVIYSEVRQDAVLGLLDALPRARP
jgi:acyl-CoA hydrolase